MIEKADRPGSVDDADGSGEVLVLVGTRPEAIKMAPVVKALRAYTPHFRTRLVLTGQHEELAIEALTPFGLTADRNLGIMREDQTLYDVAAGCLAGLRDLFAERPPEVLLVQGDTASVFFGALVGFFERIRVGHVEAGLRSGDLAHPFPEEGFRRLTGVLADFHFAPTPDAAENLRREGVPEARIHVTGNPVVDALLEIAGQDASPSSDVLSRLDARSRKGEGPFALLTAHRRESFGEPLRRVFGAVLRLVESEPGLNVLYPVHPNPQVRGPAEEILGDHPRIHLVSPLPYPELVRALSGAAIVLTDSGGIQEEAPSFGTPVLVLREVTERPEGVRAGVAELVGTDPDRIFSSARRALAEGAAGRERRRGANPYGDGRAGARIAVIVARSLGVEVAEVLP
ncbi:MAG: UDP-N-acetylglucosamine 2-epimerase (non-hydrolyzing) [Gemmatimonadales bacterium]|nr:MAG: UDP-N-acetylglucosamine 2-epimerase (non-hydrolyzing) [Gemmatimonadales bacterium]